MILLDTNIAIAYLNRESTIVQLVQQASEVYVPVIAAGELLHGALNSRHARENVAKVHDLLSEVVVLEVRRSTAEQNAHLRLALRTRGRPIPENDLWIAATSIEHDLPLATRDRHFAEVPNLRLALNEP